MDGGQNILIPDAVIEQCDIIPQGCVHELDFLGTIYDFPPQFLWIEFFHRNSVYKDRTVSAVIQACQKLYQCGFATAGFTHNPHMFSGLH